MRAYWKAWRAEGKTATADRPAELAGLTRHPVAT
jgi:hypothetical protein